jgi:hypothetical protein
MPSTSYRRWRTGRRAALDEVETALNAIGGTGRSRRVATQQVNRGYAVLLSAEFQAFCRDLHRECIDIITVTVPLTVRQVIEQDFLFHRLLDRGNPNPGNIGADFNRLGLDFWPALNRAFPKAASWRRDLELMNLWRNAIAHNDYASAQLGGTILRVAVIRRWRRVCTRLARAFDRVMRDHLHAITGTHPWS